MEQTLTQKIIAAKAGLSQVRTGRIATVQPDLIALYDWPGFDGLMRNINIDPDRVALNIDHYFSPPNETIAKLHRNFRATAEKYGIKKFYDVGRTGIGFHLLAEQGHIRPGMLVVHADPHVSTLSALGGLLPGGGGGRAVRLHDQRGLAEGARDFARGGPRPASQGGDQPGSVRETPGRPGPGRSPGQGGGIRRSGRGSNEHGRADGAVQLGSIPLRRNRHHRRR